MSEITKAVNIPQFYEAVPVAIDSLKPNPSRARVHDKKQIKKLAACIQEFGFVGAIVIDRDDMILTGDARIEAARKLGMDKIPAICVDHLTPAQVRAFILADNRLAELATWDKAALKREFKALITLDPSYDLTLTGFEIPEIDQITLGDDMKVTDEAPIDALLRPDSITARGDVWILDHHRLLCGDARVYEDYELLMRGEKAQAVFTDPPYNVRVKDIVGLGKAKHAEFAVASGEMSREEFMEFLKLTCGHMARVSLDGAIHFICMDWRHIDELSVAGRSVYSELLNLCVWNKTNGGMGSLYRSKHELVFVFKAGKAPHINNIQLGKYGRYRTNVWDYAGQNTFHADRENELGAHPTVKPVQLVMDAILDCSHPNGIVLDPFGGSGTTLLAVEKTGRQARLIEYEPTYVDLTIRRWQKLTGKEAVHAVSGKTFNQAEKEKQNVQ